MGVNSIRKIMKHEEILDLDPDPRRNSVLYPAEYGSPGGFSI
jgi:hypothetical protein